MYGNSDLYLSAGELALLHSTPRAASVIAVGACSVVCIDRASFTRLLAPPPLLSLTLSASTILKWARHGNLDADKWQDCVSVSGGHAAACMNQCGCVRAHVCGRALLGLCVCACAAEQWLSDSRPFAPVTRSLSILRASGRHICTTPFGFNMALESGRRGGSTDGASRVPKRQRHPKKVIR